MFAIPPSYNGFSPLVTISAKKGTLVNLVTEESLTDTLSMIIHRTHSSCLTKVVSIMEWNQKV